MANLRLIKRRIRSIQSSAKITKAMEMIAASKMRRTQERALASRPYADKMREVLGHLAALPMHEGEEVHPLLERRPVQHIGILHITADRGLCGGLNGNMNRRTGSFILEQTLPVSLVTVGRKGRDFMVRYGRNVRAEFTGLGDRPGMAEIGPIARVVSDDYTAGAVDQVWIAYPQFVTTMVQRPIMRQLLPLEPPPTVSALERIDYIYEPEPHWVLGQLLPRYVEMQVYHAILETIASEQSARMVAMRSASDNAKDIIQELTLAYNKARQEAITKELLDLVGGVSALAE